MISGRRATDWLAGPSSSQDDEDERRGGERRETDRRAPRRRLDPLFAATLVSQIAPQEDAVATCYRPAPVRIRRGFVVNVRA